MKLTGPNESVLSLSGVGGWLAMAPPATRTWEGQDGLVVVPRVELTLRTARTANLGVRVHARSQP